MSNLLGIEFFRVVSEPVGEDWSQVYAKVPFENEELLNKGGVFGILRLPGGKDSVGRGSELIAKLEEKYNEVGAEDLLEVLAKLVVQEEGRAEFVLAKISIQDNNQRLLRLRSSKGGWGQIIRNQRRVVLSHGEMAGETVRGKLVKGDRLFIGVGGIENLINRTSFDWSNGDLEGEVETLSSLMMSEEWPGSMASLLFEVKELDTESLDTNNEEVTLVHRMEDESPDRLITNDAGNSNKTEEIKGREHISIRRGDGVVGGVGKRIVEKIFRKKTDEDSVVLRDFGHNNNKKRVALVAGGMFLLAMAVSVLFGYMKMQGDKNRSAYQAIYEPLEKKRLDALAMVELNPSGARELIMQVRQQVAQHEAEYVGGEFATSWRELANKTEDAWRVVSGERKVTPDLFFDLSLIRSELTGQTMSLRGDSKLAIMDNKLGLVIGIEMANKKTEVIMGKGINGDWRTVLWLDTQPVVVTGSNLIMKDVVVGELGAGIGNVVGAASLGGSVYVIDSSTGELWKYIGTVSDTSNSFGKGTRWLKGGAMTELTKAVALAIDGDIWVGLDDGQIVRLRRGSKERFELTGAPSDMKLDKLAVTNDEGIVENEGKIAILNKEKARVIIFDKSGKYLKQLEWEGMTKALDLVFTNANELLILGQGKLWKIGV